VSFIIWFAKVKTTVAPFKEFCEGGGYLWDQNVGRIVGPGVPKGVFDECYVVCIFHVISSLIHQVFGVCTAFQVENNLGAFLRQLTGRNNDSVFVICGQLKVPRTRLEFIEDPNKGLVVPVCFGVVLYEVQVRAIG
jgi:hypothetical protein